ncbi:MAG: DUF1926 domain-containing protein [Deltaproteobacteria bacterium]|nr:DUF1926 domain-containing protein [Deltaproteobacteria bacterium]
MKNVQLVMAIHSHQPVGNFDSVFEEAVERCYSPFLKVLEHHPGVRVALHYSGPLYEWLESNRPEFLDKLGRLHARGQVELLGGGFYEPMLSALPRADALGQLGLMNEYLEKRFGAKAKGIWLTERVWEPEMASLLVEADVLYTMVDDTHFYYAGVEPRRLFGYHVTEKAGDTMAIFAIDKHMRYSIPFRPVEQVIQELSKEASEDPRGVIYGDDGEKFGIWPGTYDWVFSKGWLENFFEALEETDLISVLPPGDYLEQYSPSSRIYLPTASYEEMLTWAMPATAIHRYEDLKQDLEKAGLLEEARPFIRGGLWQNFMVKYDEANHMHKKMLHVSRKFAEAIEDEELSDQDWEKARRALYRGQCNCAYWHGLFGGLYLPHLRDAIYRQLIQAEKILDQLAQGDEDWISFDLLDFDCDLNEEVIVENALVNVYIDPHKGGCITELDYRPADFCLTNTLSRRVEGYHRQLLKNVSDQDSPATEDAPTTIHEITRAKQPGLQEKVISDSDIRRSFIDRFPARQTSLEDLQRATYVEEGDFLGACYHVERVGIDEEGDCDFNIQLTRAGHLTRDGQKLPLIIEKHISVPADRAEIRVEYSLRNPADQVLDLLFCPELNLTLLAPDDGKRLYEFEGVIGPGPRMRTSGEIEEASWFALADLHQRFRLRLEFEPPGTLWRHPVETVSQSEEGFELIYQGSAIIPSWKLSIPANSLHNISIRLEIQPVFEDAVVPTPELTQDQDSL